MIVSDLEAIIMFQPEWLVYLKIKTNGWHYFLRG